MHAKPRVNFGEMSSRLVPETLRKTAGDRECGADAGFLEARHGHDGFNRLLLGFLDKCARVDEDRVSTGKIGHRGIFRCAEPGEHALAVYLVLAATEVQQCNSSHAWPLPYRCAIEEKSFAFKKNGPVAPARYNLCRITVLPSAR